VHDQALCELIACLLERHGAALALYAQQWTDTPEDCVQDAFLELSRLTKPPENVVAWLYRVVRNRAISRRRSAQRRARREALALRLRPREGESASAEPAVDPGELAAALEALPEVQREIVVARTWGGLTFEEIAALVGCSTSAAHRRYEAALAFLRKRLGDPCVGTLPSPPKSPPPIRD
jgi:RNA polymerase sigma-70 factor (ECF subfamily)